MALTKTPIGVNDDGTPRYHYLYEGDGDGGVLLTGKTVAGTVTLADGTVYDITPEVIEHAPGHAGPICHHIELIHEERGTFGPDWVHVCSDACGDEPSVNVRKVV
jgi:hypothetical protein